MWREEGGERGEEEITQKGNLRQDTSQRVKYRPIGQVSKMAGLHMERLLGEGQPGPWAGKVYSKGVVCQSEGPVTGRE